MKILVTGYGGQLGYDIVRIGETKGFTVKGLSRNDLDITDEVEVYKIVKAEDPDVLVHCAAYTAVDKAEEDKEAAWKVNVEGTRFLAKAAKEVNAKFVYISTDYVFDGKGDTPFKETDLPNPTGYYGLTKYEGEQQVKEILENWFVVRISWVFGINGNNFVKTMLKLAETRKELNVVGDQIGSPTYTYDLAPLLLEMIQGEKYGIYQVTNEGFCSWSEFAEEIFKQANLNVKVNSITSEEYPTKATRPKNSRMSNKALIDNGFETLPSWQDATKRYLQELNIEVK